MQEFWNEFIEIITSPAVIAAIISACATIVAALIGAAVYKKKKKLSQDTSTDIGSTSEHSGDSEDDEDDEDDEDIEDVETIKIPPEQDSPFKDKNSPLDLDIDKKEFDSKEYPTILNVRLEMVKNPNSWVEVRRREDDENDG